MDGQMTLEGPGVTGEKIMRDAMGGAPATCGPGRS